MSYLKIFPRSISVKTDGPCSYVGRIAYDFERYGRMMYDDGCDIAMICRCLPAADWIIFPTGQEHRLAGFSVFMQAMNHYLFSMLQFDPVSQWSKVSAIDYEYFFERVYFDMGTHQFSPIKKMAVPDIVENTKNFINANIRI